MTRPVIRIFPTAEELTRAAAREVIATLKRALRSRRTCCLALSGGRTPRPVYRALGSAPLKNQVRWENVHFLFADERVVPPDDPRSNFGMVTREFFSRIPIPPEHIHRVRGERDASVASRAYETTLRQLARGGRLRLDLVLLGVGEDGHTASLFPGTDAVTATGSLVCAVTVPGLDTTRVTLTFDCINDARNVLFLVAGRRKAAIAAKILSLTRPDPLLPASLVQPREGRTIWMLDEEAARLLTVK